MEQNVDLPDSNLKQGYTISNPDPQICANDCANDPECRAFTYVKPGFRGPNSPPECWLKRSVPRPLQSDCCISGVKSQEETAPSVDWNNIPGLVLFLVHSKNQKDLLSEIPYDKPNFIGWHDLGASEGEGFGWLQLSDNQHATDWSYKYPSGLVLALTHHPNLDSDLRTTLSGERAYPMRTSPFTFYAIEHGGDLGAGSGEGFYWFETENPLFNDWDEAEQNLPIGSILGLKHSLNQPGKTVSWRGQQYDPVKSYRYGIASPPTFTVRHGGDLGAPKDEGYYWYEKTTGPYLWL